MSPATATSANLFIKLSCLDVEGVLGDGETFDDWANELATLSNTVESKINPTKVHFGSGTWPSRSILVERSHHLIGRFLKNQQLPIRCPRTEKLNDPPRPQRIFRCDNREA